MTPTQNAAFSLLQCDFRFLYTLATAQDMVSKEIILPSYWVAMIPYVGLITDGAEDWIFAMQQTQSDFTNLPTFSAKEKTFYEAARSGIKLWEKSYSEMHDLLRERYIESEQYFSSLCKPIAKTLKLYDIFGAYRINGHYVGNTILWALILPGYNLNDKDYGPMLKEMAEISGLYARFFNALESNPIASNVKAKNLDYCGFVKSPVGNKFSYKFVLFSLLCQINFIIYGVDKLIESEMPAKLRFSYILYYYLCDVVPEINAKHSASFYIDTSFKSREFRNAMAHYKVGAYLKSTEVDTNDFMYGISQKAFGKGYLEVKEFVIMELLSLSDQIESFLKLASN